MLGAGELSVDDKRTTRLEATISKPPSHMLSKGFRVAWCPLFAAVKRNSSLVASLAPSAIVPTTPVTP